MVAGGFTGAVSSGTGAVWIGGTDAARALRVELAAGVKKAACPASGLREPDGPSTLVSVGLRGGGSAGVTILAPQCTQKRASS
jgi:hypothetical protein